MALFFWKLPERQGAVKPVNPAAESQATYMGVNPLRLTAVVFPNAQSTDLRASLLVVWF